MPDELRLVPNQIAHPREIDRARLRFDLRQQHAAYLIYNALRRNEVDTIDPPSVIFQCECGELALLPAEGLSELPQEHPWRVEGAQCAECGDYATNIQYPPEASIVVLNAVRDLKALLIRARQENYATLCWYFWQSLSAFAPRYSEIYRLSDRLFDLHARILLEAALDYDGVGIFRLDLDRVREESVVLQLLLVNHVTETAEMFDIIASLAAIARREHVLVEGDGHRINPNVGMQFEPAVEDRDRLSARLKAARHEVLKSKAVKLSVGLKRIFNPDVRNAFSHSQYRIVEHAIVLTRFNRTLSDADLQDAFVGAYLIQKTIYEFMAVERQRFIEAGGCVEGNWRLTPVIEGDRFAIQISSPP